MVHNNIIMIVPLISYHAHMHEGVKLTVVVSQKISRSHVLGALASARGYEDLTNVKNVTNFGFKALDKGHER